jgi:ketosteroid isomerase-like protein
MTTPTDVVLAFYAKLTAGDARGALALMTDDIEWIPMMDYTVDGRGPQKVLEGMLIPAPDHGQISGRQLRPCLGGARRQDL